MAHWSHDAVFYHIYPLGLCGAPHQNRFDAPPVPRLAKLRGWIEPMRELGVNALYLGPLFESSAHGYDTADYYHLDRRLGSDETLAELAADLRANGIRLILDGVFNHVGRDFWAFRDLLANGQSSAYRDWFAGVDFGRRSPYGDPFAYVGWNDHYDLVKLNLSNPEVRAHLFGAVRQWVERFGIDGLRLDVAELIDPDFLRELAAFCKGLKPDFWLMGEQVHGDYRRLAGPEMLDSATNYEVYKGLYSSLNDRNYFEVAYALNRQFGPQGLYRGLPLYNFADNHDVNRVATLLREPAHLVPLYALLFTIPGVPSVYYGSEWGLGGQKGRDDWPLRPRLSLPEARLQAPYPDLASALARFARLRHSLPALRHGDYTQLHVAAEQLAFARRHGDQLAVVALNAAATSASLGLTVDLPDGTTLVDALEPGVELAVRGRRLAVEVPGRRARVLVSAPR
ncbi:MAG: alpha-amylase [Chloroflexales bacterium]|nr:alpha-amylase [Chloroflexales bacterium]